MATIISLLLGAMGNAVYDLAGWAAGKLVSFASVVRRRDRALRELHKIEYAYAISRVPTHILKLITAFAILLISTAERLADTTTHATRRTSPDTKPGTSRPVRTAGAVAIAITVTCGITVFAPSAAMASVSGSVLCLDGDVVGVWVEGESGGSGFADLEGIGEPTVTYSYNLKSYQPYSMVIGCGGTPSEWESSNRSPVLGALRNSLVCTGTQARRITYGRARCATF